MNPCLSSVTASSMTLKSTALLAILVFLNHASAKAGVGLGAADPHPALCVLGDLEVGR